MGCRVPVEKSSSTRLSAASHISTLRLLISTVAALGTPALTVFCGMRHRPPPLAFAFPFRCAASSAAEKSSHGVPIARWIHCPVQAWDSLLPLAILAAITAFGNWQMCSFPTGTHHRHFRLTSPAMPRHGHSCQIRIEMSHAQRHRGVSKHLLELLLYAKSISRPLKPANARRLRFP